MTTNTLYTSSRSTLGFPSPYRRPQPLHIFASGHALYQSTTHEQQTSPLVPYHRLLHYKSGAKYNCDGTAMLLSTTKIFSKTVLQAGCVLLFSIDGPTNFGGHCVAELAARLVAPSLHIVATFTTNPGGLGEVSGCCNASSESSSRPLDPLLHYKSGPFAHTATVRIRLNQAESGRRPYPLATNSR